MIALNRKLPKDCFNCPCFATYVLDKENVPNVQYLVRFCEATKQELVVLEWDKSETIPDVWMNFSKPKWCPWQEIDTTEHDDEYSWHHSMAGFGGDY